MVDTPPTQHRINEVDAYQQLRDQDYSILSSFDKPTPPTQEDSHNLLINKVMGKDKCSQADIRSVLSTSTKPSITYDDKPSSGDTKHPPPQG